MRLSCKSHSSQRKARRNSAVPLFWCHSPTELTLELKAQIDCLGSLRHLISPNKIHYAHIGTWARAYPEAITWASPSVRDRAAGQRIEVSFDADLEDEPPPQWVADLEELIFRGSRFMEELSRPFARSAAHARHAHRARTRRCTDQFGIQERGVRVCRRQHARFQARGPRNMSTATVQPPELARRSRNQNRNSSRKDAKAQR